MSCLLAAHFKSAMCCVFLTVSPRTEEVILSRLLEGGYIFKRKRATRKHLYIVVWKARDSAFSNVRRSCTGLPTEPGSNEIHSSPFACFSLYANKHNVKGGCHNIDDFFK